MSNAFTKLYLLNRAASYNPSATTGAWDDTAGAVVKSMDPRPEGGGATTVVARAETSSADEYDVLLYQGISGPLAAQTISGNVDVVIGIKTSSASQNAHWHLHVWVTQGDSATPRGTLLSDYREAAGTNEWPTTATFKGLTAATALSSLAISAGDRLVVEIGYASRNTSATSYAGTLNYGTCAAATLSLFGADGAAAGTDVTSKYGFVSFQNAITEQDLTATVAQQVVRTLSLGAPSAVVAQQVVRTLSANWAADGVVAQLVVRTLSANTVDETQTAVPTSDISQGNWTPSAGSDLYPMIDELGAANDADYISSAASPSNDTAIVGLGALDEPEDGTVSIELRGQTL